jgi:hypothetical protein
MSVLLVSSFDRRPETEEECGIVRQKRQSPFHVLRGRANRPILANETVTGLRGLVLPVAATAETRNLFLRPRRQTVRGFVLRPQTFATEMIDSSCESGSITAAGRITDVRGKLNSLQYCTFASCRTDNNKEQAHTRNKGTNEHDKKEPKKGTAISLKNKY